MNTQETMTENEPLPTVIDPYDSVINKLTESLTTIKAIILEVKTLKKESSKSKKKKKQKKDVDPNKPPPFSKPVEISNELRTFLDEKGDISRTDVTKRMYAYIKENNLQNQEKKREFTIDEKLAKLFKLKKGDSIEYFKLQTHMKDHFPKTKK